MTISPNSGNLAAMNRSKSPDFLKRETQEVIQQLVNMQRERKKESEKDKNNYDSQESENDEGNFISW